jgi:hypothetical protein
VLALLTRCGAEYLPPDLVNPFILSCDKIPLFLFSGLAKKNVGRINTHRTKPSNCQCQELKVCEELIHVCRIHVLRSPGENGQLAVKVTLTVGKLDREVVDEDLLDLKGVDGFGSFA